MPTKHAMLAAGLLLALAALGSADVREDETFAAARQAYDACEYVRAAQLLHQALAANPSNAEIHLLLAETYYESQQHDAAIASAEKAVALDPKKSVYHEWLGRAYGERPTTQECSRHCRWRKKLAENLRKPWNLTRQIFPLTKR